MRVVFTLLAVVSLGVLGGGCGATAAQPTHAANVVATARSTASPTPNPNPKELGWARWGRDYSEAEAVARRTGKPIFLLFQEVPGCSTCAGFGESVLSHPLLVEAIETTFVPVAIHNNRSGPDAEVLKRFAEPAWNNPVVRFVDGNGADVIPRADGMWSTHEVATRMVDALHAQDRDVPDYLSWVVMETAPSERATFAMGCGDRRAADRVAATGVRRTIGRLRTSAALASERRRPVAQSLMRS